MKNLMLKNCLRGFYRTITVIFCKLLESQLNIT